MAIRTFALLMAVIFGMVGGLGFVPGAVHSVHADAPPLVVDQGYGLLLGLFPVNVLHNLVHVAFALLGMAAFFGVLLMPVTYARLVALSYWAFAVMGLMPVLNTFFGLVPLYGADVILHIGLAAVATYFGFYYRAHAVMRV
jgi:hypothetical protein